MPIIRSIFGWLSIKRSHQIELFKQYPFDVQKELFQQLIQSATQTEWGKQYGYEKIHSIEDFQKAVPLQDYEDVKPYIDLMRDGKQNLLWPGEIKWFAKSSGTTNDKSKFIPISKESLEDCHYRGGKDILALYIQNYPNTKFLKGKGLTLGGSQKIDNVTGQTYSGDLSAILIHNLPFWADFIKTPNKEIALLDRWEEKLDKITQETVNANVTSIAGVPSWMLVLLQHILKETGKENILELWPNLEFFVHGGVSFDPYRSEYQKIIPSDQMHYMETYNASEGFFAIQDDLSVNDMLLMLDLGIFYEFIPMSEFESENPTYLTVENVELNVNYAMVISTNGGLWRYVIGDTVKFTSLYPHKIKITGRTKHHINAFGEELIIDNAKDALKIACDKTNANVSEYTAAPVFMSDKTKGKHEWIIEFYQSPQDMEYFTTLLDNALQAVNSDYEAKRYHNVTMDMPLIHVVQEGTFYKWMEQRGKLGGQNKVPRLSNSREYVESILALLDQS